MRLLCLAALLAATSVSFAQQPVKVVDKTAPTASTTAAAETPDKPEKVTKIVCHREKPVGSQMVKRRCFTEAQLQIEREQALNVRIDP